MISVLKSRIILICVRENFPLPTNDFQLSAFWWATYVPCTVPRSLTLFCKTRRYTCTYVNTCVRDVYPENIRHQGIVFLHHTLRCFSGLFAVTPVGLVNLIFLSVTVFALMYSKTNIFSAENGNFET